MSDTNHAVPSWSFKDIAAALVFVLLGSYGFGMLLNLFFGNSFSSALLLLIAGFFQTLLFLGAAFFIVFLKGGNGLGQLGLKKSISADVLRKGFLGGALLFVVVLLSGVVASFFIPMEAKPQPFVDILVKAETPFDIFVPFLVGGILAPLGEEIFFRGFAYPVLRGRFGAAYGIVGTAVFFSLLHFDIIRFLPIALGGVGLGWLYENTGSVYTPIIAHSVWNTAMLVLLLLITRAMPQII
ncbi:MAG: CPBP family intramembrane metalloprotease [Clostridia bacterium]|nr:CPBP family intramembrane metalloprotease [Clostridia bacterium]